MLERCVESAQVAAELLAAARSLGVVHVVNLPEGDPTSSALAQLAGVLDLRQHELALLPR